METLATMFMNLYFSSLFHLQGKEGESEGVHLEERA